MANGEYKSVDEAYLAGFDHGVRYVYNMLSSLISHSDTEFLNVTRVVMRELEQDLKTAGR